MLKVGYEAHAWACCEGHYELSMAESRALASALAFESTAGNIALVHGAKGVVIGGGLSLRIADVLTRSGFAGRFAAKGRFERVLSSIPVKIITHPQPGLFGAAAAFAKAHHR